MIEYMCSQAYDYILIIGIPWITGTTSLVSWTNHGAFAAYDIREGRLIAEEPWPTSEYSVERPVVRYFGHSCQPNVSLSGQGVKRKYYALRFRETSPRLGMYVEMGRVWFRALPARHRPQRPQRSLRRWPRMLRAARFSGVPVGRAAVRVARRVSLQPSLIV